LLIRSAGYGLRLAAQTRRSKKLATNLNNYSPRKKGICGDALRSGRGFEHETRLVDLGDGPWHLRREGLERDFLWTASLSHNRVMSSPTLPQSTAMSSRHATPASKPVYINKVKGFGSRP
jgi:hypothetical protein